MIQHTAAAALTARSLMLQRYWRQGAFVHAHNYSPLPSLSHLVISGCNGLLFTRYEDLLVLLFQHTRTRSYTVSLVAAPLWSVSRHNNNHVSERSFVDVDEKRYEQSL